MADPALTVHITDERGEPMSYETNCFMCQRRASGLARMMPIQTVKVRIVDHEVGGEFERWMCETCLDIARRDGKTEVVEAH